jgi:hypothetical protein
VLWVGAGDRGRTRAINAPARLRGAGAQGLVLCSRRKAIVRLKAQMNITGQQVKAARELLGWSSLGGLCGAA